MNYNSVVMSGETISDMAKDINDTLDNSSYQDSKEFYASIKKVIDRYESVTGRNKQLNYTLISGSVNNKVFNNAKQPKAN